MCGPLALAAGSAVPGIASSVLGFIGQNQAATANTRAANLSYANTANQLATRSAQIDAQQSGNTVQAMIDRITAQGRISASASSMGGDQATTDREANASNFNIGRNLGTEDINSENQRIGVGYDYDNAFYARQTQENQVLPASPLQLALGVAKGVAGGAATFSQLGGSFSGTSPDASPGNDSEAFLGG